MTIDTDALLRRVDDAERRYQDARAALRNQDGTPIYTDHDAREAAASMDFRKALSAISAEVDTAAAEASATLAALDHADPTAGLTTDELTRVDVRSRLLTEDARDLPTDVVLARARAALESGARGERYTWLRVIRSLVRGKDEREGLTLRALADELAASLTDQAARSRAEATIAAAQTVSGEIGAKRYMAQTYGGRRTTAGTR